MMLFKELGLDLNKEEIISFVGGGGKTTSIMTLAHELKNQGLKVLITTTTMIYEPMEDEGDNFFLGEIPVDFKLKNSSITILGDRIREGKLVGNTKEQIDSIRDRKIFDYILVEADGARRKPIKAPEDYEPVIPNSTTMTVGLIGIDALGQQLDENIAHRVDKLKEVLNVEENHIIEIKDMVNLALHPQGIFKSGQGRKVFFINKVMGDKNIQNGLIIKENLRDKDIQVIIGDVMNKVYY